MTKIITTFLSSILTLNNFLFNSVNYIQKMRREMSNVCAPLYANLFMAQFEENHIYTYIKDMCVLYLSYWLLFIIWKEEKEQLTTITSKINKKHKAIKFENEISSQKIPFLDLMVDNENNLQNTLTVNILTSHLIFMLT